MAHWWPLTDGQRRPKPPPTAPMRRDSHLTRVLSPDDGDTLSSGKVS